MKTLHMLRKTNDPFAMEAIRSQEDPVALLLIQDGVLARGKFPEKTYACEEDLTARGVKSPYHSIDYDGIVRLIAEYDRVIVW